MAVSALRRLVTAVLAIAAVVLITGPADAQSERIHSFESAIAVQPSGALQVVETITVTSAGDAIRRGIFRDFPTRSLTEHGLNHRVGFEIRRIERDGRPEPYFLEELNAGVRIYIGDPDLLLPDGRHTYTIAYETSRQLFHRPGEDELYWNVTGDGWAFPIDRAVATIRLPDGADAGQVTAYTGQRGAAGLDFEVTERAAGRVRIETTRPLAPGEGLTVAVAFPDGFVARPTAADRWRQTVRDNPGVTLGAGLLAVLLAYYAVAWSRRGRDPAKGVVFPRFEAPDGLSPVAVGYVWNGGFRNGFGVGRALLVAITSLASKRYLDIRDDGEGRYTLSARKVRKASLPPGEAAVRRKLFAAGDDEVTFGKSYSPALGTASKALLDAFDWEYGRAYFRNSARPWFIGALIAAAAVLASLSIDAMGEEAWLLTSVLAVFGSALLTIASVLLVTVVARCWTAATIGLPLRLLHSLGQLAGAAGALLASALVCWVLSEMVAPAALMVAALPVPVAVVFWFLMKAPTQLGRRTLDAIEGYRLYLSVAESDRLNSAGEEPAVTEALFEAHLPYAMALGVEEQWTEKAMARLAAGTADPSGRRPYRPDWYHDDGDAPASRRMSLSRALSRGLESAATQAMVRPSRSGSSGSRFSSGGGSSGGGGGGGGGGGW